MARKVRYFSSRSGGTGLLLLPLFWKCFLAFFGESSRMWYDMDLLESI